MRYSALLILFTATWAASVAMGQTVSERNDVSPSVKPVTFGPYDYEVKPDHEAFEIFHPRRAPQIGPLLLKTGDRLAICGDSITEQKRYSRIMETYLTVCVPQLKVTCRQYGWSGEKTDGFYNRMDKDCLSFQPTVATLVYGMNDCRYRPFDVTNGQWYEDHYTAIVRRFKQADVRVVVGSPGCTGKVPHWVKTRSGTLDEQNLNLCALRDIAIDVAEKENVRFADIFWPMYQAQVFAPGQHNATSEKPYDVAGSDGVHPNWAGHVIMAWSLLRSLGLNGDIGTITIDLDKQAAAASEGHQIDSYLGGVATITSQRYPFCARGDLHSDASIRSGTTLVPFTEDLNRFVLKGVGAKPGQYEVRWGDQSKTFSDQELAAGIHLPVEFPENPFCEAFDRVDGAVAEKQAFETKQVKAIFHGAPGKADFEKAVLETEAERAPLAQAVADAVVPVTHTIKITRIAG
ncbi:SGNH/GDSL hydrolase family protein [Novipirellula artificiosorum]|uniref:GDSL-like Lipase/Acylhydrolase n=1 Tax=Novipirellula artificiosorum TaxID=2528016 RepID=A0A5C6DEQ7_9BACT|nr:SGNH/GDSL hydrolase family protein [Novipirellula artificiosorum]TWU33419.1 GDSL-like Lipase/Acylhydrolase [Novipirellula artificiosorum]